jgi:hypothetical protein
LPVKLRGPAKYFARSGGLALAGAVTSIAVAIALYTRFGINGTLSRDEAVYTYAGQQLAHGVPPYASIFDAKGPLASMIAGAAAAIAHPFGGNDIYAIRFAFFLCACLTVLAVYMLAEQLWNSVLAGIIAATVFASFTGFAEDALSGPDAKTPGILFAVLSIWLMIRRRWFWAALAGALAFLVWQPLVIYSVIAALIAAVNSTAARRWRALGLAIAGAAVPVALVIVYFALAGALGKFFEAAIIFPLEGVKRPKETVGARLTRIADVVHVSYKFSGVLIWGGVVALLLLAVVKFLRNRDGLRQALRDPLVCIVLVTLLAEAAYAVLDFQGYPDVYPFLPYAALGLGGAAAVVLKLLTTQASRRVATAGMLVAVAVLTAFSWRWFSNGAGKDGLGAERADACALERMLEPTRGLYALGNPVFVVMTHRRNPDRFIYLGSGVDRWKIRHMPNGFDSWTAQIRAADPSLIALGGWRSRLTPMMATWLSDAGYSPRYVGKWRVFVAPGVGALARLHGVKLTSTSTRFATGPAGHELSAASCGQ